MNTTKLSRRRLLASVPAVAATMAPATALADVPMKLAGDTTPAADDPIFALIERRRAAAAESERMLDLLNEADDRLPAEVKELAGFNIGPFTDMYGRARSEAWGHDEIGRYLERRDGETFDAFQARLAETHAAFDRDREMCTRARRECGCDEAEAALHAADGALSSAQKALAAATATTLRGAHALARYAVELRDEEDETFNAEECTSWYLLPAIERSLAGLIGVTLSTPGLEVAS